MFVKSCLSFFLSLSDLTRNLDSLNSQSLFDEMVSLKPLETAMTCSLHVLAIFISYGSLIM